MINENLGLKSNEWFIENSKHFNISMFDIDNAIETYKSVYDNNFNAYVVGLINGDESIYFTLKQDSEDEAIYAFNEEEDAFDYFYEVVEEHEEENKSNFENNIAVAMTYADETNYNRCLEGVKKNGFILYFIDEKLKEDKVLNLEAVKQNGYAIRHSYLQGDLEICLEAVKQNGMALEYIPNIHKNNLDIVLTALKQNPNAIEFASGKLKNTYGFDANEFIHNIEVEFNLKDTHSCTSNVNDSDNGVNRKKKN